MAEMMVLLAVAGGLWFWYDSMRARERALVAGRSACEREGLQLLDDTVHCVNLRFARNPDGRMTLRRVYRFEFSDTGANRRDGSIVMLGECIESLYMEPFLLH